MTDTSKESFTLRVKTNKTLGARCQDSKLGKLIPEPKLQGLRRIEGL